MKAQLIKAIEGYLTEASRIARRGQAHASASLKPDNSVVTEIDMELSRLALEKFTPFVGEANVVTEEHHEALDTIKGENRPGVQTGSPNPTTGDKYLIIVDPVDGTRNFVHGMPLYGISVGVLHNRTPWIGAISFPALNETIISDGSKVYMSSGDMPQGGYQTTQPVTPASPRLDPNSLILTSEEFLRRYTWNLDTAGMMVAGCATVELAWAALGRGVAAFFGAHIWDLAGAWPIIRAAGMRLYTLSDQRPLERFDPEDYESDSDKLKEWCVVCRPEHLKAIIQGVSPNPGVHAAG